MFLSRDHVNSSVACVLFLLSVLAVQDYADSLCEWIRTASHPGDMLSARAFAQRIDALCEWFERVALYLMIRMANQGAMRLVGVWDYCQFYSNSEQIKLSTVQ
ncbi:uncharacterized protein HKW66_Vig0241920 [Vigna angularis]|uniref:Uncharacterized protein n=1 Tax=Phaseolus angularis TaxID=3914 RepID=A0A8T0JNQ9_PHAAN|nr:uncharacterized protein HKW66_Vig0241920 [Vigna angularis]